MIEVVIFDYARTVVDTETNPPQLFPGTIEVLQKLKDQRLRMALVSRGDDRDARQKEFEGLGLNRFFEIFEVIGQEADKDFRPLLEKLAVETRACMVVGDRIEQEIKAGKEVGATTVWLQRGKFATEGPQSPEENPDYIIKSLSELPAILDQINTSYN